MRRQLAFHSVEKNTPVSVSALQAHEAKMRCAVVGVVAATADSQSLLAATQLLHLYTALNLVRTHKLPTRASRVALPLLPTMRKYWV